MSRSQKKLYTFIQYWEVRTITNKYIEYTAKIKTDKKIQFKKCHRNEIVMCELTSCKISDEAGIITIN